MHSCSIVYVHHAMYLPMAFYTCIHERDCSVYFSFDAMMLIKRPNFTCMQYLNLACKYYSCLHAL